MLNKIKQKGFTAFEGIICLFLTAIVGGTGFFIYLVFCMMLKYLNS